MSKIGFVGFGEVNTPVDVIVRKCRAAALAGIQASVKPIGLHCAAVDAVEKSEGFQKQQVVADADLRNSEPAAQIGNADPSLALQLS